MPNKVASAVNAVVMAIVATAAHLGGSTTVTVGDRELQVPSPGVIAGVVAACLLAVGVAMSVRWWNRLIALREQVRAAWGHIEADLQRRHDTIGRLVTVVTAAAAHEGKAVLLAAAVPAPAGQHAGSVRHGVPDDRRVHSAGDAIGAAAVPERHLIAVAERHPSLRTDADFRHLFDALAAAENRIAAGRRFYNDAITLLDTRVDRFPGLLVRRRVLPHPRPTLLRYDEEALATVGLGWATAPPPPPPPMALPPPGSPGATLPPTPGADTVG
jgi:LemA protein